MNIKKKLEEASSLLNQNKIDKAMKAYSDILRHDSGNAEALYYRASILLSQGESEKALNDINASIISDSSNPMVFCLRGFIHYNKGEYGPAANDFHVALQMSPDLEPAKKYMELTIKKIGNDIIRLMSNTNI